MPAAWPCRSSRARSPRSTAAAVTTSPTATSAARSAASPAASTATTGCCIPLIRTGPKGKGQFRRVSWDEALDLIASRIDEVRDAQRRRGDPALLLRRLERPADAGGSTTRASSGGSARRAWRARSAPRRPAPPRTACTARWPASPIEDYEHARLIVLWGVQSVGVRHPPGPATSREAQRKGAKLVVVDPRRTPLARQADLHLALRPGTDLPVALAAAPRPVRARARRRGVPARSRDRRRRAARRRRAVDDRPRAPAVAGLEPATLEQFADCYATPSPARDPLRLGPRAQPQRRPRGDGRPRRCRRSPASSACAAAATR